MADITVVTGNLTVSGVTTFATDTFIPSGYTSQSFFPTVGGGNTSKVYGTLYLKSNGTTTTTPGDPLATGLKGFVYYTATNPEQISRHIRTQKFTLRTGNNFAPGTWQFTNQGFNINATGMVVPYIPTGTNEGPKYSQGVTRLLTLDERLERIETSGTFALLPNEKIGFGTFLPTEKVHISNGNLKVDNTGIFTYITGNTANLNNILSNKIILSGIYVPQAENSAGQSGQFSFDGNYFYYCRNTNDWVRTALSKW